MIWLVEIPKYTGKAMVAIEGWYLWAYFFIWPNNGFVGELLHSLADLPLLELKSGYRFRSAFKWVL